MAANATRIMYIEFKSGHGDRGPARIGRVTFSKTGRTIYYGDKKFLAIGGSGINGNYIDVNTNTEYWISGPKKDGTDRHGLLAERCISTRMLPTNIGVIFESVTPQRIHLFSSFRLCGLCVSVVDLSF
jgi:hypothetical protein